MIISFGSLDVSYSLFFGAVFCYLFFLGEFIFLLIHFLSAGDYIPAEAINSRHPLPPVSVIVCLRNERENLSKLIPALLGQNYPEFEIILVADRSEFSTLQFLEQQKDRHPELSVLVIKETPSGYAPKKYALEKGIQHASHPILLFTDADCLPASRNWIRLMAASYKSGTEIVLGYGAYHKEDSFLNLLIRYDTLFTAGQYVGMALNGKPYMGVGRNLSYRKETFLRNGGFGPHADFLSGDDDLFVNRVASSPLVSVCLNPEAFTLSEPSSSFVEWFRQKVRHQSAGIHYKPEHNSKLFIFHASRFFGWMLNILLFFLPLGAALASVLLLMRIVLKSISLPKLSGRLKEKIPTPVLIILDLLHSIILTGCALLALISPPKKWR